MPRRNGKYMVQEWGYHLLNRERDDAEEMADGYRWLVSLTRINSGRKRNDDDWMQFMDH